MTMSRDDLVRGNSAPSLVLLAGPNGAGKSTIAPALLHGELQVTEFVNADVIAAGLSAFAPETAAIAAGRIMLLRARELAARNESFALETTLASRSLAPWIKSLIKTGYTFHLVVLWLPNSDIAVARVTERVRLGGHHVPEGTVRRRYEAGLTNFFRLYRPLAATWQLRDSSILAAARHVASGKGSQTITCSDRALWSDLERKYGRV